MARNTPEWPSALALLDGWEESGAQLKTIQKPFLGQAAHKPVVLSPCTGGNSCRHHEKSCLRAAGHKSQGPHEPNLSWASTANQNVQNTVGSWGNFLTSSNGIEIDHRCHQNETHIASLRVCCQHAHRKASPSKVGALDCPHLH